jgi:hypothetical protein
MVFNFLSYEKILSLEFLSQLKAFEFPSPMREFTQLSRIAIDLLLHRAQFAIRWRLQVLLREQNYLDSG